MEHLVIAYIILAILTIGAVYLMYKEIAKMNGVYATLKTLVEDLRHENASLRAQLEDAQASSVSLDAIKAELNAIADKYISLTEEPSPKEAMKLASNGSSMVVDISYGQPG